MVLLFFLHLVAQGHSRCPDPPPAVAFVQVSKITGLEPRKELQVVRVERVLPIQSLIQEYPRIYLSICLYVQVYIYTEVVTVGCGDVDLVEMRMFHTFASFSLQMNQIKTFALLSLQMNQTKTSVSFSLQKPKKTSRKPKKPKIPKL